MKSCIGALSACHRKRIVLMLLAVLPTHATGSGAQEPANRDMGLAGLMLYIHPDAQTVRVELERPENAFWDWKQANNLVSLNDFSQKYFRDNVSSTDGFLVARFLDFYELVANAADAKSPFPQGKAGECAREWVNSNAEALSSIDRGLAKGCYQVPREYLLKFENPPFPEAFEPLEIIQNVTELKTVQYGMYLANGEHEFAAKTVKDLLELSDLALGGHGNLFHYASALNVHRIATDAVHAFALDPDSTHNQLDDLRQSLLESPPGPETFATSMRGELQYFIQHVLSPFTQATDVQQLLEIGINQNYGDNFLGVEDEMRRLKARFVKLFHGHPKVFDARNTVEIHSLGVAHLIEDLSSPWLERSKEFTAKWRAELAPWPAELRFPDVLSFEGVEKSSDEEIDSARDSLLRVDNPIGKLILVLDLESFEDFRCRYHTERLRSEIGLVLIACRLFRDREMRLPHTLSELVAKGFIVSIPIDPFSGKEVKYDSARGIIWSLGPDELDNHGTPDTLHVPREGRDLVWIIRP